MGKGNSRKRYEKSGIETFAINVEKYLRLHFYNLISPIIDIFICIAIQLYHIRCITISINIIGKKHHMQNNKYKNNQILMPNNIIRIS